jgi:hypothetical protein
VRIKEGHHLVIEQIGGRQGRFAVIELRQGDLAIGVEEGLLIDAAYALERADVERILRATLPWTFALELPPGFLVDLRLLYSGLHLNE